MGTHTAWQALRQRPWRFLASPWPWRSLAYLLCGIMPSGALAAAALALLASRSSNAAPLVLPPVALALLLSGPAMARYEHWRLRLMQVDPAPGPYRRSKGAHRALQVGYGVVCTVALWLIDLAVVAACLAIPAGLAIALARSGGAGWGARSAMLAAAGVALPLAAYPLTAWAGARAALARLVLAPREVELGERLVEVTRSRARLVDAFELERRRIERDLHDGAQQRLIALTVALGMARLDLPSDSAAAAHVSAAHEQAKQVLTELREQQATLRTARRAYCAACTMYLPSCSPLPWEMRQVSRPRHPDKDIEAVLRGLEPVLRCVVTTRDPDDGHTDAPLATTPSSGREPASRPTW